MLRPLVESGQTLQAHRLSGDHHGEVKRPAGAAGEVTIGLHPCDPLLGDLMRCSARNPGYEVRLVWWKDRPGFCGTPRELDELLISGRLEMGTVQYQ
ncbi:UDP-N-acetylmuramate--L-alanine ligase [Mycolicibacterium canariasense]|uniref:UDP-N-acetylmuramate--L-alanine ligase n=1 Tax=Mycolicibacterium canariasense TaxID=228230 RepID=A0A117IBY8_MYCCR|nr:UDP-N-acetylmuramate--L-alanine ligase [Mycolicibacterium canariasense]